MIVSPFTPLFFDARKTDGIESDYIQTFSTTDQILIELIGEEDWSGSAQVYEEPSGRLLFDIKFQEWAINSTAYLRFATLALLPGLYSVKITGIGQSEVFRITNDPRILEKTTLIQYSMKNKRQRSDAVFFIDGMQYFFDFRVPGGFKDSSWAFSVESEQFVTPLGDISQLFGLATTQKKFTLGSSIGVPVHFAQMLNLILTCTHVYFDGVKYCRKESNVPEMSVPLEGVDSFIFTQMLQQSVNLDPVIEQHNQAIMRRVDSTYVRATSLSNNRLII